MKNEEIQSWVRRMACCHSHYYNRALYRIHLRWEKEGRLNNNVSLWKHKYTLISLNSVVVKKENLSIALPLTHLLYYIWLYSPDIYLPRELGVGRCSFISSSVLEQQEKSLFLLVSSFLLSLILVCAWLSQQKPLPLPFEESICLLLLSLNSLPKSTCQAGLLFNPNWRELPSSLLLSSSSHLVIPKIPWPSTLELEILLPLHGVHWVLLSWASFSWLREPF